MIGADRFSQPKKMIENETPFADGELTRLKNVNFKIQDYYIGSHLPYSSEYSLHSNIYFFLPYIGPHFTSPSWGRTAAQEQPGHATATPDPPR